MGLARNSKKIIKKYSENTLGVFFEYLLSILHGKGSPQEHFRSIFRIFLEDPWKSTERVFSEYFPGFPFFAHALSFLLINTYIRNHGHRGQIIFVYVGLNIILK